jgi:hypothetical protein
VVLEIHHSRRNRQGEMFKVEVMMIMMISSAVEQNLMGPVVCAMGEQN